MTDAQIQRTKRGLDLETAAGLADLFHELSHNPKTRKAVAKIVKQVKPDSQYAASFADVEVIDRQDEFEARQEEKELQRQKEAIVERMNSKRAALLTGGPDGSGRKYTEDDLKKIEGLMQQKGIADYDDGATLYAATLPPEDTKPSEIPAAHGATWDFPEWGKFGADPVKASRDTANQVITEFMRKRA